MPQALTEEDVAVLDTLLAALMDAFSPDGAGFDETDGPNESEETMNAIDRLRIDGKAIARTERILHEGKIFHELHFLFSNTDFPGGPSTICSTLIVRMAQLTGEPIPDDERAKLTPQDVDWATIERLAASIEIIEPAETIH